MSVRESRLPAAGSGDIKDVVPTTSRRSLDHDSFASRPRAGSVYLRCRGEDLHNPSGRTMMFSDLMSRCRRLPCAPPPVLRACSAMSTRRRARHLRACACVAHPPRTHHNTVADFSSRPLHGFVQTFGAQGRDGAGSCSNGAGALVFGEKRGRKLSATLRPTGVLGQVDLSHPPARAAK